jgi:chloramphenicol O-acetyltransferase type A
MREIDLKVWPRRRHYEFFGGFDHPHFNMCANVELTSFLEYVRNNGVSFTAAWVYVLTCAANAIPEFRQRIRPGKVIEHDEVSPSITILQRDDLFSFCLIPYTHDFNEFVHRATAAIASVKENPTLDIEPSRDDLLFMTAIPWISFTSFTHPMHLHPADSIPRFAWGRHFQDGSSVKMPLSVQGHHALMDGIHMAKFYEQVHACISRLATSPSQGVGAA